ncbi:MAG: amidohydrolase [Candidatus Micrarchaeia archaeon]|jgi:5-methylthioadenosine/S-adenosylhomocysteine deaminase
MPLLIKNATLPSGKKADILMEGGRIAKVAPSITARAGEKIDASGKIALPGLVNTHTHAAMTLFRGIGKDAALHDWLAAVRAVEVKVTPGQIRAGSALACLEMLKSGTTCFNDMYFHMDEVASAVQQSGMRAALGYSMVDMGSGGFDEKKRKSELSICEKFIKGWHGKAEGRITATVPPHSLYLCSPELLRASEAMSKQYNVPLHIHLSETRKEVFDCLTAHKLRPVPYLDSLGLLSSRTVAAHCVWLTKEEVRLLSQRKVSASLCPLSNMKLASGGVAPFPEMQSFGMNVSLGTDGSASNDSLSMFETMKSLALLVKHSRWDATAAGAQQMLSAATEGGARALGLEAGAIAEGKLADIILLDARAPNLVPSHNVTANIVYSAHAGNVTDSIINGKVVMRKGKALLLDEEKVIEEAKKEAEKLVA